MSPQMQLSICSDPRMKHASDYIYTHTQARAAKNHWLRNPFHDFYHVNKRVLLLIENFIHKIWMKWE